MRNRELGKQLQRLQSLIQRTRQASAEDFEIQAHWGKYLCVLVAGFLENALTEVYTDFAKGASSGPVANFAAATLSKIQNPKSQKFLEIAGAFKHEWAVELERFLEEDGRKDAINSIMNNRHQISHGRYSGITVAQVTGYLQKSVQVIELIEEQCNR